MARLIAFASTVPGAVNRIVTSVTSAAPRETSACVRNPAGFPRASRSTPINPPIAVAAESRMTRSATPLGCTNSMAADDKRSERGRAARGVADGEDDVVADLFEAQPAHVSSARESDWCTDARL